MCVVKYCFFFVVVLVLARCLLFGRRWRLPLFDVDVCCLLLLGCRSVFVMRSNCLPLFVVACLDRSVSS